MERDSHLEEVRALLSAEPSPEFRARIRQRVEADTLERRSSPRWGLLASLVGVSGLALLVFTSWPSPLTPVVVVSEPLRARTVLTLLPQLPPDAANLRSSETTASAKPTGQEQTEVRTVIVSPDEAAGFDAFVSGVEDGVLWGEMFQTIPELGRATEPLRIDPLAPIPPIEQGQL